MSVTKWIQFFFFYLVLFLSLRDLLIVESVIIFNLIFCILYIFQLTSHRTISLYPNQYCMCKKLCEPTDVSGCMGVCPVVCRSRGLEGSCSSIQMNGGHYVSAYNIEKLCKWIRCYTTMLLLSKHKQHYTNGQMFTLLKYDENCPRGGIHDYI